MLTVAGVAGLITLLIWIFAPEWTPRGATTILLTILIFGALNLFAIGLVGEYVAKIMEEVKGRPRLIRSMLLKNGEMTQLLPAKDIRQ